MSSMHPKKQFVGCVFGVPTSLRAMKVPRGSSFDDIASGLHAGNNAQEN